MQTIQRISRPPLVPVSMTPSVRRRIVGIYEEEVTKEIAGRPVTRRGSEIDPVVLVETGDGQHALRFASELHGNAA